ncbi:MAG: orotidine-5'-phosphate decarboxylase [Thermomicrobiales bacterium]
MIATTTATSTFDKRLSNRAREIDSLLCIGLDPILNRLPDAIARTPAGVVEFSREIIAATSSMALAFKPNLAFFFALGREGLDTLYQVCADIPSNIPIVLDCKVNDMGATAEHYARAWFNELDVDAITIAPYMGEDACAPYFTNASKGVFMLTKTSNPGSGQFQDQTLESGHRLFEEVASQSAIWNDRYPASIGLVVGATWPDTFKQIRQHAPELWYLVPGIGEQGGSLKDSLVAGLTSSGDGILASASRSVLYASPGGDFAEASARAAAMLVDQIRSVRRALAT